MKRLFFAASLLISCLLLASSDARAMGFPGKQDEMKGVHEPQRFPLIQVTHLVTSEDGRYVVAAYHQHAQNRPGTDWNAWVALWDRVTGRRMIFPNAFGPVALSADGGLLAMPFYDRVPGERSHHPIGRLGLVRMGERKPERYLRWEPVPSAATPDSWLRNPVGLCFTPDKSHVIELTGGGVLLAHDLAKAADGKLLGRLDAKQLPEGRWLGAESIRLGIGEPTSELRLLSTRRGLPGNFAARWKLDLAAGTVEQLEAKNIDTPPRPKGTPEEKQVVTTGNGKLTITPDDRGVLTVAQSEDGKVLETLRLNDAAEEEKEAAKERAGSR